MYKKYIVCLIIAAAILGIIALATQTCLFISTEQGIYQTMPAKTGSRLSLSFTHSVQRTLVVENFVVAENYILVLDSTEYKSLGVGLPFLLEDGNFRAENNKFIFSGMNRPHKQLDLRTGPEARLTLTYGDENIPLYELFPAGTLVHLWVGPFYSRWFM
jgi:hypothetical protein